MNKIDFLQGFLRSPLEVGSVIPSSKYMVSKVVEKVMESSPKTIVELGAGTGVITKELYNLLDKSSVQLIIFEKDDKMREELNKTFPEIHIFEDALSLIKIMEQLHIKEIDCIVSGLPFSLFPVEKKEEMLSTIYSILKHDGSFVMYQYSLHMKSRLMETFNEVKTSFVFRNIPPAFIFDCRKILQ